MPRMNWMRCSEFAVVLTLVTSLLVGCNQNQGEQTGGPGADVPTDSDTEPEAAEMTFTAEVSAESMTLAQGTRQDLVLTVSRGDEFNEAIEVLFEVPRGVNVLPEEVSLGPDQTETTVLVEAEDDASVQEYALEVTFEPPAGDPVVKVVTVTVEEQPVE